MYLVCSSKVKEFDKIVDASKFLHFNYDNLRRILKLNNDYLDELNPDYAHFERVNTRKMHSINGWIPVSNWVDAYQLFD